MGNRLEGKIAIVTGGGQGIGQGIAVMYAREGARLAIAARTAERLEAVRREIEEAGGQVLAVPTDVGRDEDVRALIEATQDRFGGLDILVNNAGVGLRATVDEVDMSDYDRLMDTNLKGMYLGCHFGVPLMKAAGAGSIINISSVHGVDGSPLNTVYAATKGGIIGCTRALAAELAPFQIRVNTISPGAIKISDEWRGLLQEIAEEYREEFREKFMKGLVDARPYFQPLEVVAVPEDIAYCAVYLAAAESRFVTGQNIVIDGGLTTHLSAFASESATKNMAIDLKEVYTWIDAHRAPPQGTREA